jgi:hypothetical protein
VTKPERVREKFEGLGAGGICALTRSSIGPIRKDADIAPLIEEVMQEVIAPSVVPLALTWIPAQLLPGILSLPMYLKAGLPRWPSI